MAKRPFLTATRETSVRTTSATERRPQSSRDRPQKAKKKATGSERVRLKQKVPEPRKSPTAQTEPSHNSVSRSKETVDLHLPRATPPPRIATPPPPLAPRSMELEWESDPGDFSPRVEGIFERCVRRGDELLRRLAEHGAADHETRVDLRDGRFYWVDDRGRVSAEAEAKLICTYFPQTSSVTMGWFDARLRKQAIRRIAGMPSELDNLDEEGAWRVALTAADRTPMDYLYRVRSPARCLFLSLSHLTFSPSREAFVPTTPVALVLATLGEARVSAQLGAEPLDTLRARLSAAGATLLNQAEFAHRGTDWVARLNRTGKRITALAERLPRPTYYSVAKGAQTLWLDKRLADDLVESITLLEEEWRQFV